MIKLWRQSAADNSWFLFSGFVFVKKYFSDIPGQDGIYTKFSTDLESFEGDAVLNLVLEYP